MPERLLAVIHNVSSIQRLVDSVRAAYALGVDGVIVTKAYGAAAQHGLAEVGRIAFKEGKTIAVLPDLKDILDLVKPDHFLVVTAEHASQEIDPSSPPRLDGVVVVAFNGGEPDFAAHEAKLGTPIYIRGLKRRVGVVAEIGLVLYALREEGREAPQGE